MHKMFERLKKLIAAPIENYRQKKRLKKKMAELKKRDPFIYK